MKFLEVFAAAVKQKPQNRLKCKSVVASRQVVVALHVFWIEWRVECVLMRFVSLSNAQVMMCNLKRRKKTVNYIISWWINAANVSLPISQTSRANRWRWKVMKGNRRNANCCIQASFCGERLYVSRKGSTDTWEFESHSKRLSQRNTTTGLISRFRAHVLRKLNHRSLLNSSVFCRTSTVVDVEW